MIELKVQVNIMENFFREYILPNNMTKKMVAMVVREGDTKEFLRYEDGNYSNQAEYNTKVFNVAKGFDVKYIVIYIFDNMTFHRPYFSFIDARSRNYLHWSFDGKNAFIPWNDPNKPPEDNFQTDTFVPNRTIH